MKEEKFKTIQFVRELIVHIDKQLENFPKKDIEIKHEIKLETYELLKTAYIANTTSDRETRIRNLENMIVRIKLIDFFMNLAYDKQIINHKKYLKIGERLDDIAKYTMGWLKNTKSNQENP